MRAIVQANSSLTLVTTSMTTNAYRIPFLSKVSGKVITKSGVGVEGVIISFTHIDPLTGVNDIAAAFAPLLSVTSDVRGLFSAEIRVSSPAWINTIEQFNVSARYVEHLTDGSNTSIVHKFKPSFQVVTFLQAQTSTISITDTTTVTIFGSIVFDPKNLEGNTCAYADVPVVLVHGNGVMDSTTSTATGTFNFSISKGDHVYIYIPDYNGNTWNSFVSSQSFLYNLVNATNRLDFNLSLVTPTDAPTASPTVHRDFSSPYVGYFLAKYANGPSAIFFTTLAAAQAACPSNPTCNGITQEPYNNNRYTLRQENSLVQSPSGETSWLLVPLPTSTPTFEPTFTSSVQPVFYPTILPKSWPTTRPTPEPTFISTKNPVYYPTVLPTLAPTVQPTSVPSCSPTSNPVPKPTYNPFLSLLKSSTPTVVKLTTAPTQVPVTTPSFKPFLGRALLDVEYAIPVKTISSVSKRRLSSTTQGLYTSTFPTVPSLTSPLNPALLITAVLRKSESVKQFGLLGQSVCSQLITNGDFELNPFAYTPPNNCYLYQSPPTGWQSGNVVLISSQCAAWGNGVVAPSGQYYVALQSNGPTYGYLQQTVTVPPALIGTTLTLKFSMSQRLDGVPSTSVTVRINRVSLQTITLTNKFTRYSINVKANSSMTVRFDDTTPSPTSDFSFLLDNVTLSLSGCKPPTAAPSIRPSARPSSIRPSAKPSSIRPSALPSAMPSSPTAVPSIMPTYPFICPKGFSQVGTVCVSHSDFQLICPQGTYSINILKKNIIS